MYKIYKLIYQGNVIYIGQTKRKLQKRKGGWYKFIPVEIKKESVIELIEETDDVAREKYWISYYQNEGAELYNIRKGGSGLNHDEFMKLYRKEYYESNKERMKLYRKEYYESNKERMKDIIRERKKEYYKQNRDNIRIKVKKYYLKKKQQSV